MYIYIYMHIHSMYTYSSIGVVPFRLIHFFTVPPKVDPKRGIRNNVHFQVS